MKVTTEYGWAILSYRRYDFTAVICCPRNGIALTPQFEIEDHIGLRLVFACKIRANALNSRLGGYSVAIVIFCKAFTRDGHCRDSGNL